MIDLTGRGTTWSASLTGRNRIGTTECWAGALGGIGAAAKSGGAGSVIGGTIGGIGGFFLGGPAGAMKGASLGATGGGLVDKWFGSGTKQTATPAFKPPVSNSFKPRSQVLNSESGQLFKPVWE